MSDFWKSYDITAAEYGAGYECYPLFGTVHLIELALSALFLLGMVWWYRRSTPRTRRHILVGVTAALLADEAALLLGMACTGQWNWSYLPLHLCSINVFVCLYNTLTDRSWCKEELYALCIPGAALALLCPSWRDVPGWFTLINLHSVSIHALLVLYPVLLVAGGYRPSVRRVPDVRPLGSSREEALSRSATRPLPVRFPAGRVFFFQFASFWRFAVFFHQCSGNVKILLQRA